GHVAQAHPPGGILFRARRHRPPERGRRDADRATLRRLAGRAGPVAPGVQRHRRRSALAYPRRTGGNGIAAWRAGEARPVADLSGRSEAIAEGTRRRHVAASTIKFAEEQTKLTEFTELNSVILLIL